MTQRRIDSSGIEPGTNHVSITLLSANWATPPLTSSRIGWVFYQPNPAAVCGSQSEQVIPRLWNFLLIQIRFQATNHLGWDLNRRATIGSIVRWWIRATSGWMFVRSILSAFSWGKPSVLPTSARWGAGARQHAQVVLLTRGIIFGVLAACLIAATNVEALHC